MPDLMRYAFIDESGTVGVSTGTHFLVIGVICANETRLIEILIKRAQKKFGTSLASGEMKAHTSREEVIFRLLKEIARADVAIISIVIDQRSITLPPKESEEIYRWCVSRAICQLVQRYPRIEIYLDQRYTHKIMRYSLEKRIREEIADLPQKVVLLRQENSQAYRGLQAADFISWAFFQKYERDDSRFFDIIASKVIWEECIVKKNWSKIKPKKVPRKEDI